MLRDYDLHRHFDLHIHFDTAEFAGTAAGVPVIAGERCDPIPCVSGRRHSSAHDFGVGHDRVKAIMASEIVAEALALTPACPDRGQCARAAR